MKNAVTGGILGCRECKAREFRIWRKIGNKTADLEF